MNSLKPIRLAGLLGLCSLTFTASVWAQANTNQPQNSADNPQPTVTNPQPDPANPQTNPVDQVNANANRWYNGVGQSPWFNDPEVRRQLKLNDDQIRQLNQGYAQSWNRYYQGLNQLDKGLNEQQRVQQLHQLNGGFYRDLSRSANTVYADPAARERFHQLQWQYRGYGALADPAMQQQLNLSNAQRQDAIQANQAWNRRMASWHHDYVADPDSVLQKYNESRSEFNEGMRKILTPQQQVGWDSITGQPYEFPPQIYFQNVPLTTTTAKPVLK